MDHPRTIIILLLLCLLPMAQASQTETEPVEARLIDTLPALFSALATANQYHSYRSLITFEANSHITTVKLSHDIVGDTVYEKLMFMDGPMRQVVRKQSLTNCLNGETRWGLWPTAIDPSALGFYTLKSRGVERVANREAIVFDIMPTDKWRYGYRYSVDRETGIVLRVVTYLEANIVERLQTITIDYSPPRERVDSVDDLPTSAYSWRVPEVEPCTQNQFQSAWQVNWLPDGFVLAGNRLTAQGEQVLIFSDGLVSVSVFLIADKLGSIQKATAHHGSTVVVITPAPSTPGTNVAVVGEIPISTARRIAVSVKPQR